jgi:hypothetical protein
MKFERKVEILKAFRLYKTNLTLVQLARHMEVQYWEATMSCLWLIKGGYGQKDLLYQRNEAVVTWW